MNAPRELIAAVSRESGRRNRDLTFEELGRIASKLYPDLDPFLQEPRLGTSYRIMK